MKRFILGMISSALFAVGLAGAADRIDPLSREVPPTGLSVEGATPTTTYECDVVSNVR